MIKEIKIKDLEMIDGETYSKIYHPFRKRVAIYISTTELWIYNSLIIKMKGYVSKEKDDSFNELLNSLLLLLERIDIKNNLSSKTYTVKYYNGALSLE